MDPKPASPDKTEVLGLETKFATKKGVGFLVHVFGSFAGGLEARLACPAARSLKKPTLVLFMV